MEKISLKYETFIHQSLFHKYETFIKKKPTPGVNRLKPLPSLSSDTGGNDQNCLQQ